MREIKFRAWNGKSMFYSHNNQVNSDVTQLTCFFNRLRDTAPIMQYTGLKDKNGEEVYEGDVLKIKGFNETWKTKVRFDNGGFLIDVEEQPYNITLIGFLDDEAVVEIIGNIYENPELL